MGESSLFAIPGRLAAEGEQLVVHRFADGSLGLACLEDVRRHAHEVPKEGFWQRITCRFQDVPSGSHPVPPVCVPSGAHLIRKGIPGSMQQKCGLESEEGAVLVHTSTAVSGYRDELRFNNGVQIRLEALRTGQLVEVLSLAGTHAVLYEQELQMQ